jgi:hypothetical protein
MPTRTIPHAIPASCSHAGIAATYDDELLEAIIADLGKRILSNLRDHETRFLAERLKACRAERRARKEAAR